VHVPHVRHAACKAAHCMYTPLAVFIAQLCASMLPCESRPILRRMLLLLPTGLQGGPGPPKKEPAPRARPAPAAHAAASPPSSRAVKKRPHLLSPAALSQLRHHQLRLTWPLQGWRRVQGRKQVQGRRQVQGGLLLLLAAPRWWCLCHLPSDSPSASGGSKTIRHRRPSATQRMSPYCSCVPCLLPVLGQHLLKSSWRLRVLAAAATGLPSIPWVFKRHRHGGRSIDRCKNVMPAHGDSDSLPRTAGFCSPFTPGCSAAASSLEAGAHKPRHSLPCEISCSQQSCLTCHTHWPLPNRGLQASSCS
jgi:hypothetical protein